MLWTVLKADVLCSLASSLVYVVFVLAAVLWKKRRDAGLARARGGARRQYKVAVMRARQRRRAMR